VTRYLFEHALGAHGWLADALVEVDDAGMIARVTERSSDATGGERVDGWVIPGIPNAHSHAYLRALAGHAERLGHGVEGNLWSWRERMYDLAMVIGPEELEDVAAQAYLEMLRTGFTTVAEFHYLHRDPEGRAYRDPAELANRLISAADRVGIGLTLLPTFYTQGGFARPLSERQQRFRSDGLDGYAALVDAVELSCRGRDVVVGLAPHSVRAVAPQELRDLAQWARKRMPEGPIHIHVAEQEQEVTESMAHLGERPVAWLAKEIDIGPHWTLVHATHATRAELATVAASRAIVCICAVTEAHLGDGIFPLADYEGSGGMWSIGSDANVGISVIDELRLLEYGQRLIRRRRDVHPDERPGEWLLRQALRGGAAGVARSVGEIAPGRRADFVQLDAQAPALAGHGAATLLDAWLVSGSQCVRGVIVGGRWRIRDGRHADEEVITGRFRSAVKKIWSA
jgi:formimidoylglutamate deiminase